MALQDKESSIKEFSRTIAKAAKSLEAGKDARSAERLARTAGRARAPTAQEAEESKGLRKAESERVRALTKVLVPLASIGSRDGIERALAQGANLANARERGLNPAMAAILGGHGGLAMWIMGQPGHAWADQLKLGMVYSELSAALSIDDVNMFEHLCRVRPGLLSKSKGFAHNYYQTIELMDVALNGAPRIAAWLASNKPEIAEKGLKNELPYWMDRGRALSRAIGQRLPEAAELFEFLRGELEDGGSKMGPRLVDFFVRGDDATSLAWVFTQSPKIALEWAGGVYGSGNNSGATYGMKSAGAKETAWDERLFRAAQSKGGSAALRIPMAIWAAGHKACDCVDFLLDIPAFNSQVASCQSQPEDWFWEAAYLNIGEPRIVASLAKAGFDFAKPTPGDWAYPALFMRANKPTIKWLEMVGKEMSNLLGARALDGKTPFDMCSDSHGAELARKARACAEKVAMKGVSGRKRGGGEAKAKAAPRRL